MKRKDAIHIGDKFGEWTIIARGGKSRYWVCKCSCGTQKEFISDYLWSGHTRSCGRHLWKSCPTAYVYRGAYGHPLYRTWTGMMERCYNENCASYYLYGGRGIVVDSRWHIFENFASDMSPKLGPNYSLDRMDNNGNYSLENCRWATWKQQAANKRASKRAHLVKYKGITLSVTEWAKKIGIKPGILFYHLNTLKWTPKRALSVPKGHHG